MTSDHRHSLDWLTWLCAGITAVSLQQAAMFVALLSGLASLVLFAIRVHDRWKYGPQRGKE